MAVISAHYCVSMPQGGHYLVNKKNNTKGYYFVDFHDAMMFRGNHSNLGCLTLLYRAEICMCKKYYTIT